MIFGQWGFDAVGKNFYMDTAGIECNTGFAYEKNMQLYMVFYEKDGSTLHPLSKSLVYNFVFPVNAQVTKYQNIPGFGFSGTLVGFVSKGNKIIFRPEYIVNTTGSLSGSTISLTFRNIGEAYLWSYQFAEMGGMAIY